MKRLAIAAVSAACLASASRAAAQGSLSEQCAAAPSSARATCYAVAQAATSAQPQVGIAIVGGNPTLGTASTGGVHLGILPRVSGTLRVNAAFARLPDVLQKQNGSGAGSPVDGKLSLPIPTVGATVTVGVFPGVSIAPTLGGVGAIDLMGTATLLPLGLAKGFDGASAVSWGGGVRVGLLRESFTMPGVSATVTYRKLPTVRFGSVCPDGTAGVGPTETCAGGGNAGEARFDLGDLSTRLAVSKRLLAIGFAAGVGYDRFRSDLAYAYRYSDPLGSGAAQVRRGAATLKSGRTSAFANASLNLLVASATAEVGWMRGGDPIAGYDASATGYDPRKGTPFASLGIRLSL
ncbi:MAG: hypothetical protein JWM27_4683 [Gemmatimonadetes bacterium]|nr:hypothetical protein [Gemmatimonadota bacterium]